MRPQAGPFAGIATRLWSVPSPANDDRAPRLQNERRPPGRVSQDSREGRVSV